MTYLLHSIRRKFSLFLWPGCPRIRVPTFTGFSTLARSNLVVDWRRILAAGCCDRRFSVFSPVNTRRMPEQYLNNRSTDHARSSLPLPRSILTPFLHTHTYYMHYSTIHAGRPVGSFELVAAGAVPRWYRFLNAFRFCLALFSPAI